MFQENHHTFIFYPVKTVKIFLYITSIKVVLKNFVPAKYNIVYESLNYWILIIILLYLFIFIALFDNMH